jgi:quercetin dioxygenase-like cupin family protein
MTFRVYAWLNSGLIAVLVLTVLSSALVVEVGRAQGTPEAIVVENSDGFISGEGITSLLIGEADVDLSLLGDPTLRLERIDLPVGSVLPTHTSSVSEILYVDTGAVAIADGFGFTTETTAGHQLIFNPGTAYDLQQAGDVPASVFRVRVAGINEPLLDAGSAEPVIGPAGATPVMAEPTVTTVIDYRLTDVKSSDATYYFARVVLASGADTGEQSHNGPLGVFVAGGALTALSPSGATGTLNSGASAVLPFDVPLIGSNQGSEDTVVFLVGLGDQGSPLVEEITPTPVPTIQPTPTVTVPPTATVPPTSTVPPTPTIPPTLEPSPTPRPTPTPVPTTEVGTILQLDKTWRSKTTLVTVMADASDHVNGAYNDQWFSFVAGLEVTIVVENLSTERVDLRMPFDVITVIDDQQNEWPLEDESELPGDRLVLEPGESKTYILSVKIGRKEFTSSYTANLFIVLSGIADIPEAVWAFTYDGGRILNAPDNLTPPIALGQSTGDGSGGTLSMTLPSAADMPNGLVQISQRTRSLSELAENYTDPDLTEQQFSAWGWRENAIASFGPPGGESVPDGKVNGVYVSIHQFGSSDFARQALDFSLSEQVTGTTLQEVQARQFGEYTRALYGPMDYRNEITLLTQQGDLFIRVSASTVDGDPTPEAEAIMDIIVARIPAGSGVSALPSIQPEPVVGVPMKFLGTWTGIGVQRDPDVEWPISVDVDGGAVGEIVGTTDYPTYPCGGQLVLTEYTETYIRMIETLTYGADLCASGGTITLSVNANGGLDFVWEGIGGNGTWSTAAATLAKSI